MSSSARVPATASHTPFFPLARYTSIVGVHSSLVLFTALFLPRTSLSDVIPAPLLAALPLRGDGLPTPVKGTDHPQPLFLVQLTASPVATLAWICAGLVLLQVWWAEWLKKWAEEYQRSLLGTGEKAREAENKENDRLARTGAVLPWRVDDIAKVGDAAACTGLATTLVYGVLVCAGAPLTRYVGFLGHEYG
jgi:phosphatidylinositol glycan class F